MTMRRITIKLSLLLAIIFATAGLLACSKKLSYEEINTLYESPLSPVTEPLKVYHLGHSLVGKDMPVMLAQLAGQKHQFSSQLGWGAALKSHWDPKVPINGFETSNEHAEYRDPMDAIESQEYDAFVMTEMVEIKHAIEYFNSPDYLAKFAKKINKDSPKTTIYLYESWHHVTDPAGWIKRLDNDLKEYWEEGILLKALADINSDRNNPIIIYMIPVGQVMSAFFKEVERLGGIGNIKQPEDIFKRKIEDGSLDPIHLNDIGNYLVALVHYSVLYRQSPEGLPSQLKRADGEDALAPLEETALLMQKITWDVVTAYPKSGLGYGVFRP
jgi:hypothetical protein